MRSVEPWIAGVAAILLLVSTAPRADSLSPVHQQRYAMGTIFDIVVYHPSRTEAARAVDRAMAEVSRLDRVMSHFDADSDLWTLIRTGRREWTRVDPSLYEVIEASLGFSRQSGGKFDVTIAPLVRLYRDARQAGHRPSGAAITAAGACVGYELIELAAPDRIRLHSGCLEIDLGGIGKGYAVDRALAVLRSAGIDHAIVNAGASSIGATGAPPGRAGWPVRLDGNAGEERIVLLRNRSLSTSQQADAGWPAGGEIVDPHTGAPLAGRHAVSVLAPSATASDALATTLVMLPVGRGKQLLAQFDGVSAEWRSPAGAVETSYGELPLQAPYPERAQP
jgi:thiamine biosynthesis lipoprotein